MEKIEIPSTNAVDANDHPTAKKHDEIVIATPEETIYDVEKEDIEHDAQAGVQKMQAATSVWTKGHLIAAYAL
jgi:hypothetical protein